MKTGREKIQGGQRGCLHHIYLLCSLEIKEHMQGTSNEDILPCGLSTVFPRAGLLEELLQTNNQGFEFMAVTAIQQEQNSGIPYYRLELTETLEGTGVH